MHYRTYPVSHKGRFHHVAMTHAEQGVHRGLVFTHLAWQKLATAGIMDVTFTTPAGYTTHFTYSITSAFETNLKVYKDSVVTSGTVGLARNRNETSLNTDTVSVRVGGTVDTVGTLIAEYAWGSAAIPVVGPNVGGDIQEQEIIWPENTVRRFRLTSAQDDNNIILRTNFFMEKMPT